MSQKYYPEMVLDLKRNSGEIYITPEPHRTNMSREPRIEGWLGTTNNVSRTALGEFKSIEGARAEGRDTLRKYGFRPRKMRYDLYGVTATIRGRPVLSR